ncbi:MAG: nucleotide exchange factor GrpE [Muribaculaceae bacterium]|nr:nucleotide exchange factor GrpE [Muribaculaceae bacterium]
MKQQDTNINNRPADEESEMMADAADAQEQQAEVLDDIEEAADGDETESLKNMLNEAQQALEKEKKEYLFLMAEFDNFRKRTLKEKAELLRNGAESAMKGILPIVDDFERGLDAIKDASDAEAVKEGMTLIYNKFVKYLEQNGVKAMVTNGQDYDADLHEAVALVPGDEANKGKIIDTMQKGYMLNDKVLRHAKVAVGQ